MPPNDPDPMFAAFYSACERDAAIERREAWKAEARQRWDEAFPMRAEPSAWMPAPPPPCIRREASRVYRWLILAAAMALLLVAMANSKGCEGQPTMVKGGSNG